jgi:hypothetical protein
MLRLLTLGTAVCWLLGCASTDSQPPGDPALTPPEPMMDGTPQAPGCDATHRLKARLVRLAATELREHVRKSLPGTAETALSKVALQAEHLARVGERAVSGAELGAYFEAAGDVARSYVGSADTMTSCRQAGSEESCLQTGVRAAVDRLYRQPASAAEWSGFENSFRALVATTGVAEAAAGAVAAALVSPRTLFRTERPEPGSAPSSAYALSKSDAWIQARFALTGSAPGAAELAGLVSLDAAAFRQALSTQARGWVQTPEFAARALDFVKQRFGLLHLQEVDRLDPLYTPEVRTALTSELTGHVQSTLLSTTGSFDQLFTTTPAAVFPGLEAIYAGDAAALAPRRKGILGLAGLLAAHSGPAASDPVKRGIMVRVDLLCEAMPPPIPDADFGKVMVTDAMQTRERFEALAALPACTSCHMVINPPGYLFEEFDQLGRYRTQEKDRPINAKGTIPPFFGGEPYPGVSDWDGIVPLADWLAHSTHARTCFATHFASWLLSEGVPQGTSNCELPTISARFLQTGRLADLAADFVQSELFLSRTREVP